MRVHILAFLMTFISSRLIYAAFGFHYSVYRDPFDPVKLAIDLGVFGTLLAASYWVLGKARGGR